MRGQRKPRHAALPVWEDNKRSEQRSYRRSTVSPNLEERLRHAVPAARRQTSDPRRFRMENRRTHADQRRGQQKEAEGGSNRQQQQTQQGEYHADRERIRQGFAVGILPDERLQDGGRHLVGERQQADLAKVQMKRGLQNRVDGGQQRLHRVVQQMTETGGCQHPENGCAFDQAGGFDLIICDALRSHAGCV
jgi:hypothetical protein